MMNTTNGDAGQPERNEAELAAVRAWAQYAGKGVPDDGPIPQEIFDQFDAAFKKEV